MAAYHIQSLDVEEQTKHFTEYRNGDNLMVVRFLAGLLPLALNKIIKSHYNFAKDTESIHWMFEAKFKPPPHESYRYLDTIEDPFLLYAIGYLIATTACQWDICIGGRDMHTLLRDKTMN